MERVRGVSLPPLLFRTLAPNRAPCGRAWDGCGADMHLCERRRAEDAAAGLCNARASLPTHSVDCKPSARSLFRLQSPFRGGAIGRRAHVPCVCVRACGRACRVPARASMHFCTSFNVTRGACGGSQILFHYPSGQSGRQVLNHLSLCEGLAAFSRQLHPVRRAHATHVTARAHSHFSLRAWLIAPDAFPRCAVVCSSRAASTGESF